MAPALGVLLVAILGRLFVPPDGLLLVTFTDPTGLPDTTLFGTALEVATAPCTSPGLPRAEACGAREER